MSPHGLGAGSVLLATPDGNGWPLSTTLFGPLTKRPIPGAPPSLINRPPGCAFHPRCFLSQGRLRCREEVPALEAVGGEHRAACHFSEELVGYQSKFSEPVVA